MVVRQELHCRVALMQSVPVLALVVHHGMAWEDRLPYFGKAMPWAVLLGAAVVKTDVVQEVERLV